VGIVLLTGLLLGTTTSTAWAAVYPIGNGESVRASSARYGPK
jgi:hypothetical protein